MSQLVPLKWRKYLLLRDFDLLPSDELEGNVRRYQKTEGDALRTRIQEELCANKKSLYLFVIKLVPFDKGGQLPNLRISDIRDLDRFPVFLANHSHFNFQEIWFCRTRIDPDSFSVAGRISFSSDSSARFQIVEQVWRCSPRMIEYFSLSTFDWPFASAFRLGWGRAFTVDRLYLPQGITNPPTILQLKAEFGRSLLALERARGRLERFTGYLETYWPSYSIEYKLVDGKLSFIDFDTPDDQLIFR